MSIKIPKPKYYPPMPNIKPSKNDYILKPCPFCNNESVFLDMQPLWNGSHGYYGKYKYIIKCQLCGCTNDKCCGDDIYLNTKEEINELIRAIINHWNNRVEPSVNSNQGYYIDNEGYERCNNCNEHETGLRYFKFCPNCGEKMRREK